MHNSHVRDSCIHDGYKNEGRIHDGHIHEGRIHDGLNQNVIERVILWKAILNRCLNDRKNVSNLND